MSSELSFSKKMTMTKMILSSLFARKQTFLVVNGRKKNKLFFTTISRDRAEFYKPDIDDQIMSVQLSEKASEVVYEMFPIFKDVIAIFHLPKFLSMMNKKLTVDKGIAPVPDVNPDNGEITFSVPEGMSVDDLFKTPKERAQYLRGSNGCLVGCLITEDVFDRYESIVEHFLNFVKEPIERELTISQAFANDRVILNTVELQNTMNNCVVSFNLPVQDGTTIPSFKEYLTKKKLPWTYRAHIQYNEAHSVAKVSYAFSDDWVDVTSVSPGVLWFPFRKM